MYLFVCVCACMYPWRDDLVWMERGMTVRHRPAQLMQMDSPLSCAFVYSASNYLRVCMVWRRLQPKMLPQENTQAFVLNQSSASEVVEDLVCSDISPAGQRGNCSD